MTKLFFLRNSILIQLLVLFIAPSALYAAESESWSAAKARMETIAHDEQQCEQTWNLLWPWAKKGNLEARHILLLFMNPPLHVTVMLPPGNAGDIISRQRDSVILLAHSLDYQAENHTERDRKDFEAYRKDSLWLFEQAGFGEGNRSKNFMECAKKGSKGCVKIALKSNLIPSFESYAKQIDILLSNGISAQCLNNSEN